MLYSPAKLAVAGIVLWLLIWLVMPLNVTGYLSPIALTYIAAGYAAMMVGDFVADPQRGNRLFPDWSRPFAPTLFWATATLGVAGISMRVIDRVVFRGAQYNLAAVDFRETLTEVAPSAFGVVGGFLFGFCFVPLIILLASRDGARRISLMILASTIFALPAIETFFQLSRSFMLMTIALAFAAVVITRFRGNPLHGKLLVFAVAGILAAGFASTAIFSTRLGLSERVLTDSIFESVYGEHLEPNGYARLALAGGGTAFEESALQATLPNGMYYLTGLYEFTLLWDRPDEQVHTYGVLTFYPVVRTVALLFPDILEEFDEGAAVHRLGVWQTFFGPLWIDFGWFGIGFMFLFGMLARTVAAKVIRGSLAFMPLHLYFCVVIVFMPVVNMLTNGLGLFTVGCFTLFTFMQSGAAARSRSKDIEVGAIAAGKSARIIRR